MKLSHAKKKRKREKISLFGILLIKRTSTLLSNFGNYVSFAILRYFIFLDLHHWLGFSVPCWIKIMIVVIFILFPSPRRRLSITQEKLFHLLKFYFICIYSNISCFKVFLANIWIAIPAFIKFMFFCYNYLYPLLSPFICPYWVKCVSSIQHIHDFARVMCVCNLKVVF